MGWWTRNTRAWNRNREARPRCARACVHTRVCIASARTNNSLPTTVGLPLAPTRFDTTFAQTFPKIRSDVCPKNLLLVSINYPGRGTKYHFVISTQGEKIEKINEYVHLNGILVFFHYFRFRRLREKRRRRN